MQRSVPIAFGADAVGELSYAHQAISCLCHGMVLLGDRNFATYKFFARVAATGSDFLIRAKTGRAAVRAWTRQCMDAAVTVMTEKGTSTSGYRLITTMLDPVDAPARCPGDVGAACPARARRPR